MTRTAACRVCGKQVRYVAHRFAWVHARAGRQDDHAPVPGQEAVTPRDHRVTPKGNTGGMTPGGDGSSSTKDPQDAGSGTHHATVAVARREPTE